MWVRRKTTGKLPGMSMRISRHISSALIEEGGISEGHNPVIWWRYIRGGMVFIFWYYARSIHGWYAVLLSDANILQLIFCIGY